MRLLPPSLFGRLLLFLAGDLVIAQLLSAAILLQDRDQALYHAIGDHVAQRIAAIVALLDTLSDDERQRLANALDLPPTRIRLDLPWQLETAADERYHAKLFRTLLKHQLGSDRPFQVEINDDLPPPPIERPRRFAPDQPPPRRNGTDRPPRWRNQPMLLGLRNFVVQIRLRDGATVTFEQVLPEEIIAWPARLLLILLVLLVSVAVLAAPVADTPERLTLIVRDRGPGIPTAELERVFEPFYRLENSRSRDTGGTGLGLRIARNIARAHGGELTLHNHPQSGLEAVLELPR